MTPENTLTTMVGLAENLPSGMISRSYSDLLELIEKTDGLKLSRRLPGYAVVSVLYNNPFALQLLADAGYAVGTNCKTYLLPFPVSA